MSKIENSIINNLKMLALDAIFAKGNGDVGLSLSAAPIFYTLFMHHLQFSQDNMKYLNRDRLIVNDRLLPLLYSSYALFYKEYNVDNLKEYSKFSSPTKGFNSKKSIGVEIGSLNDGDIVATSAGIALGENYLESLIKIENNKCDLINFKTICICTEEDIMSGISYEALSFVSNLVLNKYILIIIKDGISKDSSTKEVFSENLIDRFISLKFNVEEVNGDSVGSLRDVFESAYKSKKPTAIIVDTTYGIGSSHENTNKDFNEPLSLEEMNALRNQYKLNETFEIKEENRLEIEKNITKRLNKIMTYWQNLKNESLKDIKIKEIINFLTNGMSSLNFKPENIKIGSEYEENLLKSNNKIFNILANKSPFILCGSNDNFYYTLSSIKSSDIMSKENPTGRNILFGGRTLAMGGIACGLASLGFKMFIGTPLQNANMLMPFIKLSSMNDLGVNFIFTNDTFMNTYENKGICPVDEISNLRNIPDIINFRPADINEIIGVYDIISSHNKTCTIILSNQKTPKLLGTNSKYVLAGAYRVKKESENLNAILIATGSEVLLALKIASELASYGIDFRVISMPSRELYEMQKEKYQNILLPEAVPVFALEFASSSSWFPYVKEKNHILGINSFGDAGTKEELLNYYGLDIDSIKVKILAALKNK